jgi:hypothetical protein
MKIEVGKTYKFLMTKGNWTSLGKNINIYVDGISTDSADNYNVRSVLFGRSWMDDNIDTDFYFTAKVKRLVSKTECPYGIYHKIFLDEETIKLAEK